MDSKEKIDVKQKLGAALQKIIEERKASDEHDGITSLRKLAASSGVEYSIIQKISSGKKDPQFTTLISLADGLNITITEFFTYYEQILESNSQKEIRDRNKKQKKRKK